MIIEIRNVDVETQTGKNGKPYQKATVTYKDTSGKPGSKTLLAFNSKEVWETIVNASKGEKYEVTSEKKGEYWEWTAIKRSDGTTTAGVSGTAQGRATSASAPATRSTYETPEERAKKQIYIVRQSSISTAVDALSVGAKSAPSAEAVLALAKQFEDYVFDGLREEQPKQEEKQAAKADDEFNDDIPF